LHDVIRRQLAQVSRRRSFHRLTQDDPRLLKELFRPKLRLRNDVDGAIFQSLHCTLRTFSRKTRTNHYRYRMLAHDLAQKRKPIHSRHFNIKCDHIRHLLTDPLGRHEWISRRPNYLNLRIARQHIA
jgi:hypothetical protein